MLATDVRSGPGFADAGACPWASALDLASRVSQLTVCNRFHEETSSARGPGGWLGPHRAAARRSEPPTNPSPSRPGPNSQSPLFSAEELPALLLWFRGRNSGSRGWGTGAGSRGSLRSVAASRDCHSHPRGVRWHHRCVFSPPKSSGPEGFSSRNPVAEFLRPLDGTVVPRKDRRPPPFVLEKKKKGKKNPRKEKTNPRQLFRDTLPHFLLGLPEPGLSWGPAAPPFSGFSNGNLVSPVPSQSCISAALSALANGFPQVALGF